MTLIVVTLLAAAGGLVVAAASVLRWAAAHRDDMLAVAGRASGRLHMQRVAGLAARLRPPWLFGMSTALGLIVVTLAAVGAGVLMEDVTDGDGVAALDHPVAGNGVLTLALKQAVARVRPPLSGGLAADGYAFPSAAAAAAAAAAAI